MQNENPTTARFPTAFSIIELLVVIGVMAILAAILLPVLARARLAAQEQVCVVRCRELGGLLAVYAGEHEDRFPAAIDDGPETARDPNLWDNYTFQVFSTFAREPWHEWAGLGNQSEVLYCSANQDLPYNEPWVCNPDFVLSASVYAESAYFAPDIPEHAWRLRLGAKVQTHSAAVFPSQKVGVLEHIVWHGWPGTSCIGCSVDGLFYYDSPRPGAVWFLDGHAGMHRARDALPHVRRYPIWPYMPFGTTEHGIAGRDVP